VSSEARLELLYDVSHKTCKEEEHEVDGRRNRLFVHRKGATRAFGPGHPDLPPARRPSGQPVLIGGTMGTSSCVLVGTEEGMRLAWGSACHGAGRRMSRRQAYRTHRGRQLVDGLRERGIIVRSPSGRGVAEEAPDAYKDVCEVVAAAEDAGLARRVARVEPLVCIKADATPREDPHGAHGPAARDRRGPQPAPRRGGWRRAPAADARRRRADSGRHGRTSGRR